MHLPLGPLVESGACPFPDRSNHMGRSVRLEPLAKGHIASLWGCARGAEASWTYLRYGPFQDEPAFDDLVETLINRNDYIFFAVIPATSGEAEGWLSYCDIQPKNAAIEIGSVWFSPRLQRTRAATEAVYLLLKHAFETGYHRVVWRCNDLNAASKRAALRFGFTYEGTLRDVEIVKSRRRTTAWFSLLEEEWPTQKASLESWLADSNFDEHGCQRRSLQDIARDKLPTG